MTTTSTYPSSVVNFGIDKVNGTDLIQAADPNTLRAEVVAIETTLGATPSLSTAPISSSTWYNDGRDYTTVINRLANIEAGIVADTHTQYVKKVGGSTINITSDVTGLTIKSYSGQSANLQEWQDSLGNVLASIDATGKFTAVNVSGGGSAGFEGNLLLGGM